MKIQMLFFVITAFITHTLAVSNEDLVQWEEYKFQYNKIYKSREEEERRKDIFIEKAGNVRDHNIKYRRGEVSFELAINQFSDMTHEEFSSSMLGLSNDFNINGLNGQPCPDLSGYVPPDELDWRTKGAVTPVKDQNFCLSCWAFSTTGALEGSHFLKTKQLVPLSEQNLIDCDKSNYGCRGGYPSRALDYITDNDGIDTEESYPYTGKDGECKYNPDGKGATCHGYVNVTSGDEEILKKAVAKFGPISILFYASKLFGGYHNDVFEESNCTTDYRELNHAMLLVGYGTKNGKDYWLVKNSWATTWGMDGYSMVARNKNNMCGIATAPVYPIV